MLPIVFYLCCSIINLKDRGLINHNAVSDNKSEKKDILVITVLFLYTGFLNKNV